MAAVFVSKSAKMTMTLNAGTDPDTGKTVTKSLTINGLATTAEATPISDVVDLIAPCLEHNVAGTTFTVVRDVEKN